MCTEFSKLRIFCVAMSAHLCFRWLLFSGGRFGNVFGHRLFPGPLILRAVICGIVALSLGYPTVAMMGESAMRAYDNIVAVMKTLIAHGTGETFII